MKFIKPRYFFIPVLALVIIAFALALVFHSQLSSLFTQAPLTTQLAAVGASDTGNAPDWAAPIGIPEPSWGLLESRPDRPADWSSEVAGYYYINYEIGTDTGRTYGTPTTPRKTIPVSLPAGSYVEVHGTYNSNLIITGNGTAVNPVWILGQDKVSRPDFTKQFIVQGSYTYVDNIYFSGGGYFQVGSSSAGHPANHIMFRNSEAEGTLTTPTLVGIVASINDPVSDVIVYNSVLHDTGPIDSTTDIDSHIISLGGANVSNVSNIWILDNTLYNSSGAGVQTGYANHVYVGRNSIYRTRQAGLAVKFSEDTIFSQNDIHNVIHTSWSASKGIGFQYQPQRLWIIYNNLYDNWYGIRGGSTTGGTDWYVYIIGNVIHNAHASGPDLYGGGASAMTIAGGTYDYIVNNTIYDSDSGIVAYYPGTHFYLENNIINNIATTTPNSDGNHISVEFDPSLVTVINSILYNSNGGVKIKWASVVYNSLAQFQSATGKCIGCLEADPLTAARDAGTTSDVYQTFQNLYGLDIRKDFNGVFRPQGSAWDIGAYESTDVTPPPEPPPEATTTPPEPPPAPVVHHGGGGGGIARPKATTTIPVDRAALIQQLQRQLLVLLQQLLQLMLARH